MCSKEISFCAQNMIIVLGSTINIIGEGHAWSFNVHENLQCDNLNPENCEESAYNLELGLLTFLYSVIRMFPILGEYMASQVLKSKVRCKSCRRLI
jgi:hypothetical protein